PPAPAAWLRPWSPSRRSSRSSVAATRRIASSPDQDTKGYLFLPTMTTYARRLGLFSGTMAVVGGIIGGGIFRTPATVAERLGTAEAVLFAWVLGGAIGLIGAFCWGELGQRRPRAGGGYVYLRETFGPLSAFLYGWTLVLVIATGAIAAVAVTFADYTLALLNLQHRYSVPLAVAAIVFLAA